MESEGIMTMEMIDLITKGGSLVFALVVIGYLVNENRTLKADIKDLNKRLLDLAIEARELSPAVLADNPKLQAVATAVEKLRGAVD